jgi:hypothetical protein
MTLIEDDALTLAKVHVPSSDDAGEAVGELKVRRRRHSHRFCEQFAGRPSQRSVFPKAGGARRQVDLTSEET